MKQWKKWVCLFIAICAITLIGGVAMAKKETGPAPKAVKAEDCFQCHDEIKQFAKKGKHAKLSCTTCHELLDKHLEDPGKKPVTKWTMRHAANATRNNMNRLSR